MKMMNLTKKNITAVILLVASLLPIGCKNYLDLKPLNELTGNNFYKSKGDVEANLSSIYLTFFSKINESWVIGAIGESRAGEAFAIPGASVYTSRKVVEVLGQNNMISAINDLPWKDLYHFERLTDWTTYYRVIQSSNILISKLNEGIPNLTEADKKKYIAEAVFLRCFTYFWMVRMYGDVVYYTNAYQSEPLAREDMVSVLNKCIADMAQYKDDLPWTYGDPALRGVRANRGGALALMMHMNMWNAGFDSPNSQKYYEATVGFGTELLTKNEGAYRLYPIEEWPDVIKGHSEESLFEFYQSINYGDATSSLASFGDSFLRYPYKFPANSFLISPMAFRGEYMERLFPIDVADKRKELWYVDIYANDGRFMIPKFAGNIYASGGEDRNPDNSFLIFRLADAILLQAEALAELNRETEAVGYLNQVRLRAGATPFSVGQGGLKDFIFLERGRELQGEGHAWFDLVRTKRILSSQWANHPLSLDQFNRGAWTWPIDRSALNNNPKMVLNEYWISTGGL